MGDYNLCKAEEKDRTAVADIFNYFAENSYAAYPEKHDFDVVWMQKFLYLIQSRRGFCRACRICSRKIY
jgi:hypothetical protein